MAHLCARPPHDERTALALAVAWAQNGGVSVVRYRFDPSEALPHDVIDVSQRCGAPRLVYPVLVALMEKRELPTGAPYGGPCRVESAPTTP